MPYSLPLIVVDKRQMVSFHDFARGLYKSLTGRDWLAKNHEYRPTPHRHGRVVLRVNVIVLHLELPNLARSRVDSTHHGNGIGRPKTIVHDLTSIQIAKRLSGSPDQETATWQGCHHGDGDSA